jgi:GH25 family lysozyme M1 (1,4-beta-N-acetylmuramidase)
MIPGIDVSHWQNDIDWAEVKRSGVKFAFIKATEFPDKRTTLLVDNKFKLNVAGAKENDIHWGAYHFFRTHIDPIIQAQVFCETVDEFSSLPPVLDLEAAGCKGERLNYKVRQFVEEVEKITNRKPLIYTSSGFWRSFMSYDKKEHTEWVRFYPLWLAHYTSLWPTSPYPWISWSFWQYSDKGSLPGIKTYVDLNWFNGSEDELKVQFLKDYQLQKPLTVGKRVNSIEEISNEKVNQELKDRELGKINHAADTPSKEPDMVRRPEAKYSNREENWIRSYFLS